MKRRGRFTHRADRQVQVAHEWWKANRPAAPGAIRADLDAILDLIADQPGVGAPTRDFELSGVRRATLSRVRHYLYYRVVDDSIEVLAFWHTSRGSGPPLP